MIRDHSQKLGAAAEKKMVTKCEHLIAVWSPAQENMHMLQLSGGFEEEEAERPVEEQRFRRTEEEQEHTDADRTQSPDLKELVEEEEDILSENNEEVRMKNRSKDNRQKEQRKKKQRGLLRKKER